MLRNEDRWAPRVGSPVFFSEDWWIQDLPGTGQLHFG
ncbi:hypothetical protein J2Y41_004163 [Arthrobacter sp. 1088]|nr:hypothetical protein [Arthrobacter sp. 1088]